MTDWIDIPYNDIYLLYFTIKTTNTISSANQSVIDNLTRLLGGGNPLSVKYLEINISKNKFEHVDLSYIPIYIESCTSNLKTVFKNAEIKINLTDRNGLYISMTPLSYLDIDLERLEFLVQKELSNIWNWYFAL